VLLPHLDDARVDDWVDVGGQVVALLRVVLAVEPLHDVEAVGPVQLDWIAVEEVWHHHEVAVGGELVGDQLCVVELVADHVGDAVLSCVSVAKVPSPSPCIEVKDGVPKCWVVWVGRLDIHDDPIFAGLANSIDLKVAELGQLALRGALVAHTLVAALSWRIGRHG
jgi:hypothetical protein